MNNTIFEEFCHKYCDGLYDPKLKEEHQCTGYLQLKKMIVENIIPASMSEIRRWENHPTSEELLSKPDIKYLRFLHPLLRSYIVENWNYIKTLQI